jgi:hypothetical protein
MTLRAPTSSILTCTGTTCLSPLCTYLSKPPGPSTCPHLALATTPGSTCGTPPWRHQAGLVSACPLLSGTLLSSTAARPPSWSSSGIWALSRPSLTNPPTSLPPTSLPPRPQTLPPTLSPLGSPSPPRQPPPLSLRVITLLGERAVGARRVFWSSWCLRSVRSLNYRYNNSFRSVTQFALKLIRFLLACIMAIMFTLLLCFYALLSCEHACVWMCNLSFISSYTMFIIYINMHKCDCKRVIES